MSFKNQLNLRSIANNAFEECSNSERISLCGCIELDSISIPSTIKYIDDYGFCNWSAKETIIIPSLIESIGNYSFYKCINLINITIKEESNYKKFGDYSFCKCINLINISIKELSNLTKIGSYSFSYCINLKSIILPLQLKESITILSNISQIH